MDRSKHIRRHKRLHNSLDELVADWIRHTDGRPSKSTVFDLMKWSSDQTKDPTEVRE